ncbi:MAG: acyltransferase [Fimbriimonadaceae bacterium]|nr:acyltransferase [Fimbriimonadaceae bacterium]
MAAGLLTRLWRRLRPGHRLDALRAAGVQIGVDCHLGPEVLIDPDHGFLITIGDRVTLAPRVHLLAHDASLRRALGYTHVAPVVIADEAFLGAGAIVLPGVTIGCQAVVAAGAVVTRDVPPRTVVAGNPARPLGSLDELLAKHRDRLTRLPVFGIDHTSYGDLTASRRDELRAALGPEGGYLP